MPRPPIGLPRLFLSLLAASAGSLGLICIGVDWFFPQGPPPFDPESVLGPTWFALLGIIMVALRPPTPNEPHAVGGLEHRSTKLMAICVTLMLGTNVLGAFSMLIGAAAAPGRPSAGETAALDIERNMLRDYGIEPSPRRSAVAEHVLRFRYKVRGFALARRAADGSGSSLRTSPGIDLYAAALTSSGWTPSGRTRLRWKKP